MSGNHFFKIVFYGNTLKIYSYEKDFIRFIISIYNYGC